MRVRLHLPAVSAQQSVEWYAAASGLAEDFTRRADSSATIVGFWASGEESAWNVAGECPQESRPMELLASMQYALPVLWPLLIEKE